MTTYGVVPEGFSRKSLPTILAEIEAQMVTEFGPGVIQSAQSPLGQINGLMANMVAQMWELAEDVYQSFDVDQAEGTRLDILAKLRLLERGFGEAEVDFRSAITNQGRARIDIQDIVRAIRSIDGVTYAQVFLNDNSDVADSNLQPGTICVAALGGDQEEIAEAMRRFIVPGISTFGNVYVSTNIDGFCRSMAILRPILVPVKLTITVRPSRDNFGCPPPSVLAIRDGLVQDLGLGGARQLLNGDNISFFRIRSAIESRFPNVEVISFVGERDELEQALNQDVDIAFIELATISVDDVTVEAI